MLIGKPGPAKTQICRAEADRIEVRGRDLTSDERRKMRDLILDWLKLP